MLSVLLSHRRDRCFFLPRISFRPDRHRIHPRTRALSRGPTLRRERRGVRHRFRPRDRRFYRPARNALEDRLAAARRLCQVRRRRQSGQPAAAAIPRCIGTPLAGQLLRQERGRAGGYRRGGPARQFHLVDADLRRVVHGRGRSDARAPRRDGAAGQRGASRGHPPRRPGSPHRRAGDRQFQRHPEDRHAAVGRDARWSRSIGPARQSSSASCRAPPRSTTASAARCRWACSGCRRAPAI